ncbi:hypothetical protein [Psychrobacter sp.]|uniref:hypothetical protein n=1 Tax=Psychrobacter sp. TaxID=56811 RepID=UPI0025D64997|nr:hypothetical protein [Psychrobacter sp.]
MISDLFDNFVDSKNDEYSDISFDTAMNFVSKSAKNKAGKVIDSKIATSLLHEYARVYGQVKGHKALLKAVYKVKIDNIFGHKGAIPWFKDTSLCYLATDTSISLGSAESDTYRVGSEQANYLSQKSSDDFDITFIETHKGDISKSFGMCFGLAFNPDGTVNEPMRYAFKITISILDPKNTNSVAVARSYIVGVKAANIDVSASSRSEIVQIPVTFQKLRPLSFSQ